MEDQAYQLRSLVNKSAQQKGIRIIAVSSGKGGVGKTSLTANLAVVLANMRKKVLIVDADMGLANIDILLGLHPKYNLRHVLDGDKNIEDVIIDGPCGVKILPSASGVQSLADLSVVQRENLIKSFTGFDSLVDFMLIDTSAGISKNVTDFIVSSGEAIIITTPEPTAITDAYALIKVISKVSSCLKIRLFVNMAGDDREAQEVIEKLSLVINRFLGINVEAIGYMIKEQIVSDAIRKQVPFVLYNPNSPATCSLKALASKLCGYYNGENATTLSGFLDRITGLDKE